MNDGQQCILIIGDRDGNKIGQALALELSAELIPPAGYKHFKIDSDRDFPPDSTIIDIIRFPDITMTELAPEMKLSVTAHPDIDMEYPSLLIPQQKSYFDPRKDRRTFKKKRK